MQLLLTCWSRAEHTNLQLKLCAASVIDLRGTIGYAQVQCLGYDDLGPPYYAYRNVSNARCMIQTLPDAFYGSTSTGLSQAAKDGIAVVSVGVLAIIIAVAASCRYRACKARLQHSLSMNEIAQRPHHPSAQCK